MPLHAQAGRIVVKSEVYSLMYFLVAISFFYFLLRLFYGMLAFVLRRTTSHAAVDLLLPHCGVAGAR
jgi:hypothetical protein